MPVADRALEPVRVEQRQEQLEVLLLAAVRRRGHQQEVTGDLAEQPAELVALGLLDLVAEVVRRHLVRLVDDDEVPVGRASLACRSSLRDRWSRRAMSRCLLGERVAAA